MAKFETIVIFHLSTTKFSNSVRITELSLMACLASDCKQGNLPNVINQLTLAINPETIITSESSKANGVKDKLGRKDELDNWEPFDDGVISMIDNFFGRLPKPICLIAHNGSKYQFKIFMKYYQKYKKNNYNFIDSIHCADSISIFKKYLEKGSKLEIQPPTTPDKTAMSVIREDKSLRLKQNESLLLEILNSCKLKDIYYFLHNDKTFKLNNTQSKCLALLKCILKCQGKFFEELPSNSCLFSEIKPLE